MNLLHAACALFLLFAAAFPTRVQAFEISPSTLVITSRSQPEFLSITDRGQPVPASSIGSVQFLAGDHAYGRMINVERTDGGLVLRPTAALEIGTYDLRVTVANARLVSRVKVTLENDIDSIENRAAARGVTPDQFRHQLGLYTTGRQSVEIQLPEWYWVGREVRFTNPAPESTRYEWRVNGELVEAGQGPHVFAYTLRRPGEYHFEYVEQGPRGALVRAHAGTLAREPEPQVIAISPGRGVRFLGPLGFTEYTWLVDGAPASAQPEFRHEFEAPGEYSVVCIASGDSPSEAVTFQKAVYQIIVQ